MKKLFAIAVVLSLAFMASCASGISRFPANHLYIADVTNMTCVKYKIIDHEKILLQRESETRLVPKGDCDRLVGFHRNEFKSVQNWVRDTIEEFKKNAASVAASLSQRL